MSEDQLGMVSQLSLQAVELQPLLEGVVAAGADGSALAEESPLAAASSLAGR